MNLCNLNLMCVLPRVFFLVNTVLRAKPLFFIGHKSDDLNATNRGSISFSHKEDVTGEKRERGRA